MLLEANPLSRSMKRAMWEGKVEMFGGFRKIPPGVLPGWVVRVTSQHGRQWIVGMTPDMNTVHIRCLNKIPWGEFDPDLHPTHDPHLTCEVHDATRPPAIRDQPDGSPRPDHEADGA